MIHDVESLDNNRRGSDWEGERSKRRDDVVASQHVMLIPTNPSAQIDFVPSRQLALRSNISYPKRKKEVNLEP